LFTLLLHSFPIYGEEPDLEGLYFICGFIFFFSVNEITVTVVDDCMSQTFRNIVELLRELFYGDNFTYVKFPVAPVGR